MMKTLVSVPSLDPLSMAAILAPVCFVLLLPPVICFEISNIAIADVDVARRRDAMKASRDRSAGYAGER